MKGERREEEEGDREGEEGGVIWFCGVVMPLLKEGRERKKRVLQSAAYDDSLT